MASTSQPKFVTPATGLSALVVIALLAVFHFQSLRLAEVAVAESIAAEREALAARFETMAAGRLDPIALHLAQAGPDDAARHQAVLDTALSPDSPLIGLRYRTETGVQSGRGTLSRDSGTPRAPPAGERMTITRRVEIDGRRAGTLLAEFDASPIRVALDDFARRVSEAALQQRRASTYWTVSAAGLGLLAWIAAIRVADRRQGRRIRNLKTQAMKLSDSDFGEALDDSQADELGELAGAFNAMRRQLRETTLSSNYVNSVLANMNEAIIITGPDGSIRRVNKATSQMLGYDEHELVDQSVDLIVDRRKGARLEIDSRSSVPREAFLVAKSGKSIPISYTGSIMADKNELEGDRIYAAQNITERRKAEQRIRYLARIDALTKVPNRMQFQHLLQRAIARASRSRKSLCLLYIDIDHFKEINDTFGHLAGDATLETVAERLTSVLPPDSVIGRLAGDEFAVIIDKVEPGPGIRADVDRLARKLLDRLADPFYVQGHEVFLTASMGIALYPADAPNVIDLIRNADAALYHAKKNGGNVFSYYVAEMNEAVVERLMTKSKLKRAFERNELLVHYQPKYNLETGKVVGAEALVRWELPERGIILPSDFIPIAEETNLIIEIGEWVLDRVCEDFRYWQRSVSSPGRVSVNLSLKQLRQPNFISRISSILRSYELSPTSLELEITETTLMEDPPRTIKILDELYGLGLHLAIDDFGTGYSSLSALQQFPINTLKIDQSFVRDIAVDADDATIVGTIIHMGRSLNMDVVAEGVETEEQLNFLQTLQCTYAQGLLFGDPMSSDNYLELLLAQAEGSDTHKALFA